MNAETRSDTPAPLVMRRNEQIFFYDMASADDGSQWAVPWSDLMMTMFILFAMLFIFVSSKHDVFHEVLLKMSQGNTGQKNGGAESDVQLHQIRMRIEGRSENEILADVQNRSARRVLVAPVELPETQKKETAVFFRPAKATLERTTQDLLLDFGTRLQTSSSRIHLVGHGDEHFVPTADFASNLDLALARAAEVARFLIEKCGVDKKRILVSGQIASVPLVPGNSGSSRIRNRRVDLSLL